MKILISSDGTHAHYFQRLAWLNAFRAAGINASMWDCKKVNAFDAFDSFEPDVFLGQAYNLDEALIKCLYERPHIKVGLRAGDWGEQNEEVDRSKYNVLFLSDKERKLLKKLKDETGKPDFVHIHYRQEDVDRTHSYYKDIGIDAKSLMMCADVMAYSDAKFDPKLECDIGFVGGYWPHKGIVINNWLFPLLGDISEYRVKIFGNQIWPVNQYCGYIRDEDVKNLFVSAKICPNLSEPHAHAFGIDINERIFKVLYSGGFCVSDKVAGYNIFGDGLVQAESPEDFKNKIDYYLEHEDEKREIAAKGKRIVEDNHTNFHRIADILSYLDFTEESVTVTKKYNDALQKLRSLN